METPVKTSIFQSNTARLIMVVMLTFVLLIPLEFVKGLIEERASRKDEVVMEVSQKWGSNILFYGPILKVPYKHYDVSSSVDENTGKKTTYKTQTIQYAYFFPETLIGKANVNTRNLHRSIYEVSVYDTEMNFEGKFGQMVFDTEILPDDILWEKASMVLKTTNLKSIKNAVTVQFMGKQHTFEPIHSGTEQNSYEGLETPIALKGNIGFENFSFSIKYQGSQDIMLVPIGKSTRFSMQSNWASPSFNGYFLPEDQSKKISEKGFTAHWNISHINRSFGQSYFGSLPNLDSYAFGVNFVVPVDEYQKNERASKYGLLVIGLTFLVFYLIQTGSKINIHLFQYSMIGLALVLFYTLLISITEHSSFNVAYGIASVAVIVLISWYSLSILHQRKFSVMILAALSVLYGFIYVIIQLENYALLVGSIGLFLILGLVMYYSRNIDWSK